MGGGRVYNAKQNKPVRERQIPHDFTHMCHLRNKTIIKGKKTNQGTKQLLKEKRETNQGTIFLTLENKLMNTRQGWGGSIGETWQGD